MSLEINKYQILSVFFLLASSFLYSQNTFNVIVEDETTKEAMIGTSVIIKGTTKGSITDALGKASISEIPDGKQIIVISFTGYENVELKLEFPLSQTEPQKIYLMPSEEQMDEVIIEATRANRSVANLPTRTEVLTDEIDEAASMEACKIAHLITHSTGIQVQTTSASSGGAVVRIQGLNGRYTQILKDGFPIYGGFSGSLDVLQIPPLDLKQVEYIKGSASTLYGGGAIAGLVNLLTKKATDDETLLHINVSHIGAKDFNAFTSRSFGKFGFTNLASFHTHTAYDPDNDGYSDVPEVAKFNFNPKLFYYPNEKTELYFGAMVCKENRMGGNMLLIDNQESDSVNFFFDKQKTNRYTSQFSLKHDLAPNKKLTLKNSVSSFNRFIRIRENIFGETTEFGGQQLNSYSELNYNLSNTKQILNIGLNFITDKFKEDKYTYDLPLRDQEYMTLGGYINQLWNISDKLAIESGLRADYVQASSTKSKSDGETFILPRLSALYKINSKLSFRLGGGMGYRMPSLFSEEAEPYGYKNIEAIDFANISAERSYGGNVDLKYQSNFGSDNVLLTLNQMFFYNIINNPIALVYYFNGAYVNSASNINSQGFESQIKLTFWKFTWFFGYTYTDAFYDSYLNKELILTPKHSIKGDLLFVEDNKWRIGWDYEYKSEQLLSSGLWSPSLFTTGVVVERTLDNFVIFLNAENFTDARQTRTESMLSGQYNTPQFTDVWAPMDGFFFNAGLKIKL